MVDSKWDVTKHIGEVEEQAAGQSVVSMWLRKGSGVKVVKGHVVRRGDQRSFLELYELETSDDKGFATRVTDIDIDASGFVEEVVG